MDLNEYYESHYSAVVHQGLGGLVQSTFHRAVETPFRSSDNFATVLEVGATNGEHLPFIRHDFSKYIMVDIRDRETAREAARKASSTARSVEFTVGDAQVLADVVDRSVDRLVSMCLLHHINEPDQALRRWRAVVRPGGVISIFLPCDPGLLWRMGRRFTTFRQAGNRGIDAARMRYISALDHRNHVASLLWMAQGVFSRDHVRVHWFPLLKVPSWNANLFLTLQITVS